MINLNDKRSLLKLRKTLISFAMGCLRILLFGTLAFVVIYPLLTKICASFMTVQDVYDMSVQYVPKNPTIENYKLIWDELNLSLTVPLTIQYTLLIAVLQMLSATVVGYGLARFKFKLDKPLFLLVLISLIVPPKLLLVPLFSIFRFFDIFGLIPALTGEHLSLINTQWSMIILSITSTGYRCGLYVFLMRQFFRNMPKELEEAAYIDGAGPIRAFFSIMMPGSKTMMITVGLFSFVWTWLDTEFSPTLLPDYSILVTKLDFIYSIVADDNAEVIRSLAANAGVVVLIIPLVLLYIFTQKYFVQSMERSGLVG